MGMSNNAVERDFEFISQSQDFYIVKKINSGELLKVAKASRSKIDAYPFRPHNFHDNLTKIAAIGMFIGGILAVISSPLIIWHNLNLLSKQDLSTSEIVHAKNLIVISSLFFVVGLLFFALLIMHLVF